MSQSRRQFLVQGAAIAGAVTILPYAARADGHAANTFETEAGPLKVHPVSHASFVMETPEGTIYVDPVGDPASYGDFPPPDLILITHQHGDHYSAETLKALVAEGTEMVTNPAVYEKLPADLKDRARDVPNGASTDFGDLLIEAIPAYNTTEGRLDFHPEGRDNGYVLNFEGFRVYISGDTEDIPEMRRLQDIDLAFVCMNLPFTMDAIAAASAVSEFAPTYVYPYHYHGRDGNVQDPDSFARMVGKEVEVLRGNWYGEG